MTHRSETIGTAIDLAEHGLSATEIAVKIGVPRRTVSDWVRGLLPRTQSRIRESCPVCGHEQHLFADLPSVYAYLLGLYLGDGSIARHRRGVFKLRITLDAKYPAIIDEAARAMREVLPKSKVNLRTRVGDVEIYSYSKSWPCLFPQHGSGKKHNRPIVLTGWQEDVVARSPELLLRGLIQSDGCRFMNSGRRWRHPRYSFDNLSEDIRAIFCAACDKLEIHWTTSGNSVYVSRKADVARMDRWIGPKT